MLQEAKSFITINQNGRRKRISKLEGMLKQLGNKAVTGNILAARLFFGLYQQGLEKATLSAAQQPSVPGKYDDVKNLTDEELLRIAAGLEKMK